MNRKEQDMSVTMTVRDTGRGERIKRRRYFAATTRIEWVSVEKNENGDPIVRRSPSAKTMMYPAKLGFFAAGKHYASWRELVAEHEDRYEHCRDKYGREVVYEWERFPCFDSCDYANEDRFRRWFLLRKDDRLTYIYLEDGGGFVQVTEDVQDVEWQCWDKLKKSGLISGK